MLAGASGSKRVAGPLSMRFLESLLGAVGRVIHFVVFTDLTNRLLTCQANLFKNAFSIRSQIDLHVVLQCLVASCPTCTVLLEHSEVLDTEDCVAPKPAWIQRCK